MKYFFITFHLKNLTKMCNCSTKISQFLTIQTNRHLLSNFSRQEKILHDNVRMIPGAKMVIQEGDFFCLCFLVFLSTTETKQKLRGRNLIPYESPVNPVLILKHE